jgi:ATP-binding cassette subfamily C protein
VAQLAEDFAAAPALAARRFALPAPAGRLRANNVAVRRPGGGPPLLANIGFDIAAGTFVGIIGPSGAGKSTLIRVLAGAVAPDMGDVRIDDSDLADWDRERLARHLGYLPQDAALLPGTVAENISRFAVAGGADPAETDAKVLEAARAVGAHAMIAALPDGYDARLGWNGAGLSAGQRQRIAIARAFYGDPTILLLDEPDTGLDHDGDQALKAALASARARGATLVVASHRVPLLADADQLMVLNQGRLQLFGAASEVRERLAGRPVPARIKDVA